jgi:fibronectin type 3 domain-containing protein
MWLTYLELGPTANPFGGIDNVFATRSDNAFNSGIVQRITGDGFVKAHPISSSIGGTMYTVYSSYNETGASDIYLTLYGVVDIVQLPGAPTGVTATPGSGKVTISWNAVTATPAVDGYNVYRSTTHSGPYTKLNSAMITGTTYDDTTVVSGTLYYYVVRSHNSVGESQNSQEVTGGLNVPEIPMPAIVAFSFCVLFFVLFSTRVRRKSRGKK